MYMLQIWLAKNAKALEGWGTYKNDLKSILACSKNAWTYSKNVDKSVQKSSTHKSPEHQFCRGQ